MTDPKQPDSDDADGPITPEVVGRRGAAARKRRADAPPEPDLGSTGEPTGDGGGDGTPGRRPGTMVRLGCMLLVAIGVMQLFLASQWVVDPEGARCRQARLAIDAANDDDDDEDFNDVALPGDAEEGGDVSCDVAVELAGTIPADEDDEPDGSYISASSIRTQGIGIGAIGLAQGATGILVLRTLRRGFRNAALATAALGILLPILGIISLLVLVFVVYTLGFSKDAKAIWGGGGFLRPRPGPGSSVDS